MPYIKNFKLFTVPLLCAALISSNSTATTNPNPWYKNGWKVASAGWGAGSCGLLSLGGYVYMRYKKLKNEKTASPASFLLRPKDNEVLKISKVAAPCLLVTGTVFAVAALFLYRHGCTQK